MLTNDQKSSMFEHVHNHLANACAEALADISDDGLWRMYNGFSSGLIHTVALAPEEIAKLALLAQPAVIAELKRRHEVAALEA